MGAILDRLLWIPKTDIENINLLKAKLTVRSPFEDVESIVTYEETPTHLGIPRHVRYDIDYKDNRIQPKTRYNIKFIGTLRYNQHLAFKKWLEFYNEGKTDVILNLPPRSGKTILTLKIAEHLQTPFLVIVPRVPLISQWISEITRFTTLTNGKIGIVRQGLCEWEDLPASVGILHSISKDKYPDEFKNHWGLVVFDELHLMGAQEFSKVLKMFPAKYRLGLTGTLRRSDRMEDVLFYHMGKNIVKLEAKEEQPKVKLITILYKKSSGYLPKWATSKIQRRAMLFSLLADNLDRNYLIATLVAQLAKKKIRILVLSERIRQLEIIEYILKNKLLVTDVGIITGQTSKKERDRIINYSQVILAINSILGVGVTINKLRGLVFASPLSDVEQAVGRVRNVEPDMPDPIVIDIVDTCYEDALNWYKKRKLFYNKVVYEYKSLEVF
ncbi:DEAD/DEAH box helicase family protein [Thermoanaerobacter sp. A7A]|uniref:DEAD/DEAH box helicase n=1 Tax=Thermoanaerobacter sp. A7A TaxID=1350366 RepID=UPI00042480CC|nr:DEAD/DEAH box helicase family protein [Thermoanaerobacter sp. A7A]